MRKYGKARALLKWGLLPAILVWVTGCTGMVQQELDETHAKLTALRKLVESANQELTTLSGIVSELDDSHTVLPDSFESTEGGFKLSFKDGKTIEILAGHDGADGRVFPIGVAWNEEEGCFCWTIDYLDGEGHGIEIGIRYFRGPSDCPSSGTADGSTFSGSRAVLHGHTPAGG